MFRSVRGISVIHVIRNARKGVVGDSFRVARGQVEMVQTNLVGATRRLDQDEVVRQRLDRMSTHNLLHSQSTLPGHTSSSLSIDFNHVDSLSGSGSDLLLCLTARVFVTGRTRRLACRGGRA